MIARKKKTCKICKQPEFIWSQGCCKSCWHKAFGKPIKASTKWIKPHSEKQIARVKKYQALRDEYLKSNPICGCCKQQLATEVHHKKKRHGENLFLHFLGVCRDCHIRIENNPAWAYANKYSIPINEKDDEDNDT